MTGVAFASLPAWWLTMAIAAAVVAALVFAYRCPIVPLSRGKRSVLIVLRAAAVVLVLLILVRPVASRLPSAATQTVAPILVDVSGSMRIADADGMARVARAKAIAQFDLVPVLSRKYATPVIEIGDGNRSDLVGAIAGLRERFRGQRVAGVVLLSDGADTSTSRAVESMEATLPIFPIGVGSSSGFPDREIAGIAAGEQRLTDASVDLDVSASSAGFGRTPYEIRLLANGALVATRRVSPSADAAPVHVRFTVFPDPATPTVYRAEIPAAGGEAVTENNARSVLVAPSGRTRRLLVIAGAPGFEHSFMTRAWSIDPGLEVDAVVRKGKNAEARDTFVIQAPADRASALSTGFPQRREDLYAYDAIVLADVEAELFTKPQLEMIADFVAVRGGGLLVTGSRSFSQDGLIGSALEPVLPVELDARRSGVARASFTPSERTAPNHLTVTDDGARHPIMRLGSPGEETRTRWAALPALAGSTPLGQPRPGASVLAVVSSAEGLASPIVAVQKYGEGRSMIFAGEASWRWRMLSPASDRSHELFWRQAARWLSTAAPDRMSLSIPDALEPGDSAPIDVVARDAAFNPVADARVTVTVSRENGETQTLASRRFTPSVPGIYRLHAEGARGATALGVSDRTILVGGSSREFVDPRLNEGFLRRVARGSGGRYVPASDAARVLTWLDEAAQQQAPPERQDLWDRPWLIVLIATLLCVEWTLRRRWGLR